MVRGTAVAARRSRRGQALGARSRGRPRAAGRGRPAGGGGPLWRGDPLRPSLTSRDIARFDGLPDQARAVFARIVADVERSLFAGGTLEPADWTRARADYAQFALGKRA
jgi:hypothetical protein